MKIDQIKEWYIKNKKLFFASIELTSNCNFRCKHCYCADKGHSILSVNDYQKIIDKLYNEGCLFLNLTGGEILTHTNFKDMYIYAKNKGFLIDLLTNASLLNENHIELFKRFPPNNIAITIYGTNEKDYELFTGDAKNFKKTMNALKLLKQNNIHFVLRTVATKTLKESIIRGEFDKIAEKFNTSFKYEPIIFPKTTGDTEPLFECLSAAEIVELEKASQERKCAWEEIMIKNGNESDYHWTCHAGVSSIAIDFNGEAYVCGLYREKGISIIENDIKDVLKYLRAIHEKHLEIVANNECSVCNKRNFCKWCPAYSYLYNKTADKKIPFFCNLAEERLKEFGRE